ncbi:MAG: DUF1328 domain-containing protein [Hyphomicrobium sp.]
MGKSTHYAAIFAVFATLYAILGFWGGAGSAAPIAKALFWAATGVVAICVTGAIVRRIA